MKNFTFTEKDLANMKKADLINLITAQGQEVLKALQEAQQAQEEADLKALQAQAQAEQAQAVMQEVTGLSPERLQYEENKYNESVTCLYNFPAYFAQDTVLYRAQHDAFLRELGRRYIQEVLQAQEGTQAGAGRKARKAGRKASAGTQAGAGKAQDKTQNGSYSYLCAKCRYEIVEADKYLTIKKEGKTQARVYVMKDNKLKFLVKEEVAKKAGLPFTTMKFNLPCAIVTGKAQEVDAVLKAF